MSFILFVIAGVVGGLIGGMGMGGGTLLIPILSIFCSVKQHQAQAINLISFIPMAIVALIIHIKNHLVVYKDLLPIILSGVVTCVGGCFLSKIISGDLLRRAFGGFLLALSVFQFVSTIKLFKHKKWFFCLKNICFFSLLFVWNLLDFYWIYSTFLLIKIIFYFFSKKI